MHYFLVPLIGEDGKAAVREPRSMEWHQLRHGLLMQAAWDYSDGEKYPILSLREIPDKVIKELREAIEWHDYKMIRSALRAFAEAMGWGEK